MQAIFETLFDIVYLVTVVTLGLCVAFPLSGSGQKCDNSYCLGILRCPNCIMPYATKRLDQCGCTAVMGDLPQYSIYYSRHVNRCFVL